ISSRSFAFSAFLTAPSSSIVPFWTITASWHDAIPLGVAPASGMCVSVSHPRTASEWLMAQTWLYFERMSRTRGFLATLRTASVGQAGLKGPLQAQVTDQRKFLLERRGEILSGSIDDAR